MNDVFIRFRADVTNALNSLGIVGSALTNMAKSANVSTAAFTNMASTVAGMVLEMKNFGNVLLLIGNALRSAGLNQAGQVLMTLGSAFRQLANHALGANGALGQFITALSRALKSSPLLSAALQRVASSLGLIQKQSSAASRWSAVFTKMSSAVGQAASGMQHFGFVLGILGIQFKQLQQIVEKVFGNLVQEGIQLEKTLDEITSVSPDLSESFQRTTFQVLQTNEVVSRLSQLFQDVTGSSRGFTDQLLKATEGLDNVGGDRNSFLTLIERLPPGLAASSEEAAKLILELKSLQAEGLNASQAILALTARENFALLEEQINNLAQTTKFSAQEIAEGMKALSLAGFDAREVAASIGGIVDLAAAASLKVEDAAEIAASTMLAFGLETYSTANIVDGLATIANKSSTDVVSLGNSLKYVSGAAAQAGITLEETLAALGLLADVGIRGTSAGTSLNNFLKSLAQRGDNFNAVLEELGISFNEINPELVTFTEILERLEKANPSSNQIFRAFNIRGARAVSAFLKQTTEGYKELLDAIKSGDYTAFQTAEQRLKNIASQIELITSQLSAIGQSVFGTFKDDLADVFTRLSRFLVLLEDWFTKNQELTRGIAKFAGGLYLLGASFGALLLAFSGPVTLAGVVGGIVAGLLAGLAFLPEFTLAVGLLTGAVLLLAAGITGGLLVAFGALPGAIAEMEAAFASITQNAIKPWIDGFLKSMSIWITVVTEELKMLFKEMSIGEGSASRFATAGEVIGHALGYLGFVVVRVTRDIVDFIRRVSSARGLLYNFIENLSPGTSFEDLENLFGEVGSSFEYNNVVLKETVDLLTKVNQLISTTAKEASAFRGKVASFAEKLNEFSTSNVKNSRELLELYQELSKETGQTDPRKIFESAEERLRAQLEVLLKTREDVVKLVQEFQDDPDSIYNPEIFRRLSDIDVEIGSVQHNLLTLTSIKEDMENLFSKGTLPDPEKFLEGVNKAIAVGTANAEALNSEIGILQQSLKSVQDENKDLEIEVTVGLTAEKDKFVADKVKINQELEEDLRDIEAALELQKNKIAALKRPGGEDNKSELEAEERFLDAIYRRRELTLLKHGIEIRKIEKDQAKEQADVEEKRQKETEKSLEYLKEAEINALRSQGKEVEAIEKEYSLAVSKIRKEVEELKGLTKEERDEAERNAIQAAKGDRNEKLSNLAEEQNKKFEERTQKAAEAVDFEKEIFKTLLGEVKNAQDLVALYVVLGQLQAARAYSAQAAANLSLRKTQDLEKAENRLEKARLFGTEGQIKRLEELRDKAAVTEALARDIAFNQAQGIGAANLAELFTRDLAVIPMISELQKKLLDARAQVEQFKQEISNLITLGIAEAFAQAPTLWVNSFLATWAVESQRIIAAIQATVGQASAASLAAGAATAAAGLVGSIGPAVLPSFSAPLLPQLLPQGRGLAEGQGRNVNINVVDNLGLNRVKTAIASEMSRAGRVVGRL